LDIVLNKDDTVIINKFDNKKWWVNSFKSHKIKNREKENNFKDINFLFKYNNN
jgi:hypothetical protein